MLRAQKDRYFVSQSAMRWGIVVTFLVHAASGLILAFVRPDSNSERPRFAGSESITVTVALPQFEPHAPPEPIRFAPQLATAPVTVSPQRAVLAKSTYVLADHQKHTIELPKPNPSSQSRDSQTRQQRASAVTERRRSARSPKRDRSPQLSVPTRAELPKSAGNDPKLPPDFSNNPPPRYPALAVQRGWEGEVWLRIRISNSGRVISVAVLKSSGHAVLDASAVNAVKRWRAKPARRGGQPVETTEVLPIRFRRR